MEIPKEQEISNGDLSLVSLTRKLINCFIPEHQQKLQTEFYNRLAPKLYERMYKASQKLYNGLPNWECELEEILSDTFILAFKTIHKFKMGDNWDDNECQKVLLYRLSEIANRKFLFRLRIFKREDTDFGEYVWEMQHEKSVEYGERKKARQTYDRVKFEFFWNKLNQMSREILMICVEHCTIKSTAGEFISGEEIELLQMKSDIGSSAWPKELKKKMKGDNFDERNTDHLPEDVIEYLTKKYKVKSAAIRKAKQRALEGLEQCKF